MTVRKVLLVDDDEDICRIVQLCLTELAGWEVLVVHSGEEALAVAAAERPDVLLVDIMLPGMDGIVTFQRLRERPETASIPLIFMTAKVQRHEVARYRALGAAGVITKPFDPLGLHQQILGLLRSESRAEPPAAEVRVAAAL